MVGFPHRSRGERGQRVAPYPGLSGGHSPPALVGVLHGLPWAPACLVGVCIKHLLPVGIPEGRRVPPQYGRGAQRTGDLTHPKAGAGTN